MFFSLKSPVDVFPAPPSPVSDSEPCEALSNLSCAPSLGGRRLGAGLSREEWLPFMTCPTPTRGASRLFWQLIATDRGTGSLSEEHEKLWMFLHTHHWSRATERVLLGPHQSVPQSQALGGE